MRLPTWYICFMGVKYHYEIHFLWCELGTCCVCCLSPQSALRACSLSPGVTHAFSLQLAPEIMLKIRVLKPSKCCGVFFVLQGLGGMALALWDSVPPCCGLSQGLFPEMKMIFFPYFYLCIFSKNSQALALLALRGVCGMSHVCSPTHPGEFPAQRGESCVLGSCLRILAHPKKSE